MRWFNWMRQQKMLSLSLVLVTLAIGIMIGTLINTGVHAAKGQAAAPDAAPLVVPNPVQLGNEFSKCVPQLVVFRVDLACIARQRTGPPSPQRCPRRCATA